MENQQKTINWISASKIKTAESCSQIFWLKYVQKHPNESNSGSLRGGCVHEIFEMFLSNEKKYRKLVDKIIKLGKVSKGLFRLIKTKCAKLQLTPDDVDKVIQYLIIGLKNDFWMSGGARQKPETYFELTNNYHTRGYIDNHAIYTEKNGDKWVKIVDFKSQKNKFSEKELDKNIQAYIYLLAAKKLYPDIKIEKSRVEFILLQYPDDPIQVVTDVTDDTLAGIEQYLTYIQGYIDNFTEEQSVANLASNQDYPKPDEGFCGKIMCGRAAYRGELKKDGLSKKWHCQFRFPYDYFGLYEGDKLIKSAYTEVELLPLKEATQEIKQLHFGGCPAFNKKKVEIENEGFEF